MLIKLADLTVNEKVLDYHKKHNDITRFTKNQCDKDTTFIRHNLYNLENAILHSNYLRYLETCWATHHTVVLTPDIVWYTLLCELALIIKDNPETYRSLFTDSQEKKKIEVFTDDPEFLPLDKIANELIRLVPSGLAEHFLLKFSTSTDRSTFSHQAAFADAVSPYYDYFIKMCGISGVDVRGTTEDWQSIFDSWQVITEKLSQLRPAGQQERIYYDKVTNILTHITSYEKSFYSEIFRAEKCGSGSETELYGWFTELFFKQPDGVRKSSNFSTHISSVNYEHLQTKKKYKLKTGLFYSSIAEGDTLEPDFGHIIYERENLNV